MSNETTTPEETEIPVTETPGTATDPLAEAQAEAGKWRDLALRTQADLENYRKRAIRERDDAVKYANGGLLERLLPVLDNFELGLGEARKGDAQSPILVGMEMVARQLNDFLGSTGVEPVLTEGAKFDPNQHEAVGQEASETVPEGHIVRQLRRGYKLRDRLLRAALVVVSKGQ